MDKLSIWAKLARRAANRSRGNAKGYRWFGAFLLFAAVFYSITSSINFAIANFFLSLLFFIMSGFIELIYFERKK